VNTGVNYYRVRRTIIGIFFFLSALALSDCSRFMSEPTAVPIEVELDMPQEVIDGGVNLDALDQTWDGYGEVVGVHGDVPVVGAAEWNQCGPGSAFVYRFSDGEWQEESRLTASDRGVFEKQARRFESQRFGSSVAVGEGVVAVGAPGNAYPVAERYTGAVYLFEYDGQTWIETAKFTADRLDLDTAQIEADPSICSNMKRKSFGALVTLDGDTLAVGGDSSTDSVYIYQRGENGWREQARLTVPGSPGRDLYMVSIDLFGDTLALSAFYVSPQSEQDMFLTGKVIVYVFERTGNTWQQSFRFIPEDSDKDLLFPREVNVGASVALGGESGQANLLAIGLPGFPDWTGDLDVALLGVEPEKIEFPESNRKTGAVYIFERGEDGGWKPQSTLRPAGLENPPGPGSFFSRNPSPTEIAAYVFPGDLYSEDPEISFFGSTVDLDEQQLAVTSGFANATYVFERQGRDWVYRFRIIPDRVGEGLWEDYAQVVAINQCNLLLGTPGEFGDSAYVFDLCVP